jgi:hypothetical protein
MWCVCVCVLQIVRKNIQTIADQVGSSILAATGSGSSITDDMISGSTTQDDVVPTIEDTAADDSESEIDDLHSVCPISATVSTDMLQDQELTVNVEEASSPLARSVRNKQPNSKYIASDHVVVSRPKNYQSKKILSHKKTNKTPSTFSPESQSQAKSPISLSSTPDLSIPSATSSITVSSSMSSSLPQSYSSDDLLTTLKTLEQATPIHHSHTPLQLQRPITDNPLKQGDRVGHPLSSVFLGETRDFEGEHNVVQTHSSKESKYVHEYGF